MGSSNREGPITDGGQPCMTDSPQQWGSVAEASLGLDIGRALELIGEVRCTTLSFVSAWSRQRLAQTMGSSPLKAGHCIRDHARKHLSAFMTNVPTLPNAETHIHFTDASVQMMQQMGLRNTGINNAVQIRWTKDAELYCLVSELVPLLVAVLVLQLVCSLRELLCLHPHLSRSFLQFSEAFAALKSRLQNVNHPFSCNHTPSLMTVNCWETFSPHILNFMIFLLATVNLSSLHFVPLLAPNHDDANA